ncbi:MAG: hypothetical protein IKO65_06110 [Victivallales bacterium]|nr:hypothetical protein [Victivallales bacterium]
MNLKNFIIIFLLPVALFAVELPGVKELDNVQVRDFRTAGEALMRRSGDASPTPVAWRIYGATAQLRGKEYQIGGFRMDVAVPEQGSYAISTPSAVFDIEKVAAHGDTTVELTGPGMQIAGVGFDLFTDAETEGKEARQLLFVIREAVQLELDRSALKNFGRGGGSVGGEDASRITLSASRLTMQVTPNESGEGESGIVTLEGNVRLRIPPEENADSSSQEHQWDDWELSGDRMLIFLNQSNRDEDSALQISWVERVEVNGHLRVETDGGNQRLLGERGVFTTADGHLTIDGNVLMMNQIKESHSADSRREPRWGLFFTDRATLCLATAEERQAQRTQNRHESVVSRVELPGQVTMISADSAQRVVASRGEFDGEDGRVSLYGEVRGELRNLGSPEAGDYLLVGPQVDFVLEDSAQPNAGAHIVFPQGMTLQQRLGVSRVKAGWASVEMVSSADRRVTIRCTDNVLAELHGQGGQDYELFLSGSQMVMLLDFRTKGNASGLDCIEWIDLPERVTVWGKAKGVSHRVGGDRGRYERSTRSIALEDNIVLALAQGSLSEGHLEEARVLAHRATVRLEESSSSQLAIASVELEEDLVARTADFSVYVTADRAYYDYRTEELAMSGRVRAEVTPGNGQRDLKQAVTLDTTRVLANSDLQQVVFPEPLVVSSHDQTLRLSGKEGILDMPNQRCALEGGTRIAFASRRADSQAGTEVGLVTQRVLVYLAEREASRSGTGRAVTSIDHIDLPDHLELFTADGRQRLSGDRGSYSSLTNAVAIDGNVEARFAGEAFDSFDTADALGLRAQGTRRETEEMILNCGQLIARLRNEPLSNDGTAESAQRALSMLESLEIPGKVTLRSADNSRIVTGDRCRYSQANNDIVLDGDCHLEYADERGRHTVTSPQVVFDCATRTIVTGRGSATAGTEAGGESPKPARTTISIPFASHPVNQREPGLPGRGLRR